MVDKRLAAELKARRRAFLLLVGLGVGLGIFVILQASYLTKIIDGVFLGGLGLADVWGWLAVLLAVMAGRSLLLWLQEVVSYRLAAAIKSDLRERLTAHLLALGPVHTSSEKSGELVHLLVEGVENVEPYFAKYLPQLFTAGLVPVLVLAVAVPVDGLSAVLLAVTAPLIPLFMVLIGKLAESRNKRQWETLSRLSAHFLDMLQGLTTLKLFGRSAGQVRVIARLSDQFRDATLDVLKIAFVSALALELIATISTALVAVSVGLRLLYYKLTFSQAFFLLLLAPEFYLPLRQLGTHFHAGMAGTTAAERIYGVLSIPLPARLPIEGQEFGRQAIAVSFQDVHYAYRNGRIALSGLSMELAAGTRTALVGSSGAGKSTVANLLLGLLVPDRGEVVVSGIALSRLRSSDWLAQVAVVPQDPHLFSGSVADNIRFGRETANFTEVVAAAKAARAHTFIENFPDGYDTIVGEGGHGLSGGERRRLAIARAFLKDAPLLILDEATAGLDPQTESEVQQALEGLMHGRTVLVIAHRMSTVRTANQIVVLESGQAVECGSHEELWAKQGMYFQLVAAFRGET